MSFSTHEPLVQLIELTYPTTFFLRPYHSAKRWTGMILKVLRDTGQ